MVRGGADPSLLSRGSFGPVVKSAGRTVLADYVSPALAPSQPGTLALHSLWTSAARG